MINIVSTQANKTSTSGPHKVYINLIKGLDKLGYPYVINRDLNATRRLWIHDDIVALKYMHRSKAHKIVGPNLFVMPQDIPQNIDFSEALYIQPCDWAVRMWEQANFTSCPLCAWPVGIDTDEFHPSRVPFSQRKVLVYHKMRDPQNLPLVFDILHEMHLSYSVMFYGDYTEREYKNLLDETSFIIWHGSAESQGIALQEALACDIPILIWDVTSVSQTRGGYPFESWTYNVPVTAAPYFDETCGVRITEGVQLRWAIIEMLDRRNVFRPCEYILRNLSLEGQARQFVQLWDRWRLTFEDGLSERPFNDRSWKGQPILSKISERTLNKFRRKIASLKNRGSPI